MAQAAPTAEVEQGRAAYARRAWLDAHDALARADAGGALAVDDVERLATAAYMLRRDDEHAALLERAHRAHLEAGDGARAARCAFWRGLAFALRGGTSEAAGWWARAERVLDRTPGEPAERGYLLLPAVLRAGSGGDWATAAAVAASAAAIAERENDADLLALATAEQGHALLRLGRVEEGRRLLDESMVAATAGELSPIVSGLVYCSVIGYCHELYELGRAREWTEALSRWCAGQPDMLAHTGVCLVHRAEVLELQGAWPAALEEARRARERCVAAGGGEPTTGRAWYREGELRRLRGEWPAAEAAYREARRHGCEPQPGLALLRVAQGRAGVAAAAMKRLLSELPAALERARLLPAVAEVRLATGDEDGARAAADELEALAAGRSNPALEAMAATTRAAVALAGGEAREGLIAARRALRAWQHLEAPYDAARARVLLARACRALGDEETAGLELGTARGDFDRLGAAPDRARADELLRAPAPATSHGLTPRELQVLRLLAAGATNRAIAEELVLSERTVHRHVSNVFAKLRVSSRAAATAFAYEHGLV